VKKAKNGKKTVKKDGLRRRLQKPSGSRPRNHRKADRTNPARPRQDQRAKRRHRLAQAQRPAAEKESRRVASPSTPREKSFYITTAIAYREGAHIGSYEAIATDALAPFQRLDGRTCSFSTEPTSTA